MHFRLGDLDRDEFESLMKELAASEWKEAFDPARGKVYYYNNKTKATTWSEPDDDSTVADFMEANGLTPTRKPPALESLSRKPRRQTTANPLASAAFDVETPNAATPRRSQGRGSLRASVQAAGATQAMTRAAPPRLDSLSAPRRASQRQAPPRPGHGSSTTSTL